MYVDIEREQIELQNMKFLLVLIFIRALKMAPKNLRKRMAKIEFLKSCNDADNNVYNRYNVGKNMSQ